jgi:protein-tyrosine-phosphatase
MDRLPGSLLFCCTINAVRSPMAEAIMKHLFGSEVYVDSVGVRPGELNGFGVAVLAEIGIDLSQHKPKSFDQLTDSSFDLVISLSPEAQHSAVEMTRTSSCVVEYWATNDATAYQGSRERVLEAYREVRNSLVDRIQGRFGPESGKNLTD